MKIHFATSTSKLEKYKKNYFAICEMIKLLGHEITRDWLQEAIHFIDKGIIEIDREDIYKKMVASVLASNVVIVEGSVLSFSVGHQVTLALNKNKPVLFLIFDKGLEKKKFKSDFIDGMTSPLLSIQKYDMDNLQGKLRDFLDQYKGGSMTKFNLFLSQEIDNYLEWAGFTYKVNKSEYVRKIIERHILENDEKYRKYLKTGSY